MRAENFYSQLEGLSKDERRDMALTSGMLDERRFLIPPNPKIRQRLDTLREIAGEFRSIYPEVISLGLFGSVTKGYATPTSDLDAYLYVDVSRAVDEWRSRHPGAAVTDAMKEKKASIGKHLRLAAQQRLGLSAEQVHNLSVRFVDEKTIRDTLADPQPDPRIIQEWALLFLLEVGQGITTYRKVVIDTLEAQGQEGEKKWQRLMESLANFENPGGHAGVSANSVPRDRRDRLYPKTIAQARKIFFHENPTREEQPGSKIA